MSACREEDMEKAAAREGWQQKASRLGREARMRPTSRTHERLQ